MKPALIVLAAWIATTFFSFCRGDDFAERLRKGGYKEHVEAYAKLLESRSSDDNLRYQLGMLQFLQAIESTGQSWYRMGQARGMLVNQLPLIRLNVPDNPNPEKTDYQAFRQAFDHAVKLLAETEVTLAQIKSDEVAVEVELSKIGMDWNGNGKIETGEWLSDNIGTFLSRAAWNPDAWPLTIRFDRADVYWLRGYCHLLQGFAKIVLAYDQQAAWDACAHRLFSGVEPTLNFLKEEKNAQEGMFNEILDWVAAIHQMRFPLIDGQRVMSAHDHFLETIKLSRMFWENALAETDDLREWIPNPRQTPPLPGGEVDQEMLNGWFEFLDEAEALLNGEKLVPFWRGNDPKRGLNLKKVFSEPKELDVVLWFHGSACVDYLQEDLPVTDPATWQRLNRVFRGEFMGFAIWFN